MREPSLCLASPIKVPSGMEERDKEERSNSWDNCTKIINEGEGGMNMGVVVYRRISVPGIFLMSSKISRV